MFQTTNQIKSYIYVDIDVCWFITTMEKNMNTVQQNICDL